MYNVLLVDDDKTIRYMLRRFTDWERYGFCLAGEACDGREALKQLSAGSFELVITDIRMPGMNGIEFFQELKIRQINVCLIFLSTYNDFEYAQQGIRLGVFDYMTKPVDDRALGEVLARAKQHLDEAKFLRLKLDEEKKLVEESIALYYPAEREKELVRLLFQGDEAVLAAAEDAVAAITGNSGRDLLKTTMLFEKLTVHIREGMAENFPRISQLENMASPKEFQHLKTTEEVRAVFLQYIGTLLDVVRKYELHQKDGIVRRTCQYVLNHVEEDVTLEDVATEVHVSKSYIGKLFKQKTGSNFNDYVTKVKMEHAKALLRSGDYKNYEISDKLGYSSPDYFGRLFKQYSGCTPLEFRKQGL
ncbi:MAG: response regulator [Veillonellales bacterium]